MREMTEWATDVVDVNDLLLDRQIFDSEGVPVGKVDEIEFSEGPEGPPVLTALLCGPTALGPRIGGPLGLLWYSVGRRMREDANPQPTRIPLHLVRTISRTEVTLAVPGEEVELNRMSNWTRDKVIGRIPGAER
ncbi:MAG TPA: hypothetical protein VFJ12_08300 [Segeticoccus sp.]|nr:hypothetical protein [Segeticoccus sp.]